MTMIDYCNSELIFGARWQTNVPFRSTPPLNCQNPSPVYQKLGLPATMPFRLFCEGRNPPPEEASIC